jgi:AcrR family transcriptional regulator
MTALLEKEIDGQDRAKRQQIMDGARQVFLEHGFDGASVADIVKAAGVSKGTLYAYFPSKEKLFETLIFEDRRKQAERLFDLSAMDDGDMRAALIDLGCRMVMSVTAPDSIAYVRTVIAAAGKFPEAGRAFYEAGPGYGVAQMQLYLEEQRRRGRIAFADGGLAAQQLVDLMHSGCTKPLLFGDASACDPARIVKAVTAGVDLFMAAYGVKG